MNEYKKKLAAQAAGQVNKDPSSPDAPAATNAIPNSVLNDVFAGTRKADSQMMGHRVNLAESINAKMSQAFGMDLSGLKIYRSDAMAGTGMHGMAQGNKVVLSSDVNLNTTEGQAVLGHELSHIRAQSQGIGMGHGGLYNNAALEHQADIEGMRAAHARPIFSSGMEFSDGMKYGLGMQGVDGLAPMSPGLGAAAAAPMQAMKDDNMKVNKGLLAPKKKSFGSSLKEKFASFTPTARRNQLNAAITQQLAAFGITVVDEDVSKQSAATETQDGQQNNLPFSTPFGKPTLGGFPTSPVVNDPDHKLLPSKDELMGGGKTAPGWFSNSPLFDQDTKWPSKEAVLGGGKTTSGVSGDKTKKKKKIIDINDISFRG